MSQKTFNTLAGVVFLIVGLLHLVRFASSWSFTLNEWIVPLWVSGVAFVVLAYLTFSAFRLR